MSLVVYNVHQEFHISDFIQIETCNQLLQTDHLQIYNVHFLAPTGALEEGILCVRACVHDIIQNNSENEF